MSELTVKHALIAGNRLLLSDLFGVLLNCRWVSYRDSLGLTGLYLFSFLLFLLGCTGRIWIGCCRFYAHTDLNRVGLLISLQCNVFNKLARIQVIRLRRQKHEVMKPTEANYEVTCSRLRQPFSRWETDRARKKERERERERERKKERERGRKKKTQRGAPVESVKQ